VAYKKQDEKNITRFTIGTYNYDRWIKPNPKPTLEVFEDDEGKWHWCLRTKAGEPIARSVSGFNSKTQCESAQALVAVEMREAVVVEVEDDSEGQKP
jgi:uncharacterized protein YegP (UPF0339 family)